MIELCLDGNPGKKKYILTGADGEYQVGDFDGRAFIPGTPKIPGQRGYGNAMYAAQTFANMPGGRVVQIGWFQTPAPGMTFNQSMGFPCELTLRSTPDGPRMAWNPIGEISRLAVGEQEFGPQTLQPGENPLAGVTGRLLDIEAVLEPEEGAGAGFRIRGVEVVYDSRRGRLLCPGLGEAELAREDGLIHLRLLVDRISIEIFGNRGLVYMPVADKPLSQELGLGIFARGGTVKIHALTVREICSIW